MMTAIGIIFMKNNNHGNRYRGKHRILVPIYIYTAHILLVYIMYMYYIIYIIQSVKKTQKRFNYYLFIFITT